MRQLLSSLLVIFALCANGVCDDVYEIQIGDASGIVEWEGVAKVTQKVPGIRVRIGVADKALPHYRATVDNALGTLRANTAAVSGAYTKTHFHTRVTTETKTTAPIIQVNPTPVTVSPNIVVNPTPVTVTPKIEVNPTPITVTPTPVVVNPTPVFVPFVRPHYEWYRCPSTGRLIYGLVP
ncbi:MAG: chitinase [Candidatus Peregrinibacteria bacterium Greene1014_49]|nr:MAG: chitinase [Candidatus Peregrinibacteria bacterium Greene1014_49]